MPVPTPRRPRGRYDALTAGRTERRTGIVERGGMDAYDEGSNPGHAPDGPRPPAPPAQRVAPAGPAETD
ncbi:hypothetical protein, partial [Streptomyces sp. NRRL S-146]|uniref:hypothetical protein n=1 Tax=Streptomyces sp. NRRL S-146 TaxID=1463884 RepID=UPI003B635401